VAEDSKLVPIILHAKSIPDAGLDGEGTAPILWDARIASP
jgi:hypothetical protein